MTPRTRKLSVLLFSLLLAAAGAGGGRAEDLSGLGYFLGFVPQITEAFTGSLPAGQGTQREVALGLLRKYSPTGYYLVNNYSRCPAKYLRGARMDLMEFITGDSPARIADDLNVAIHEICHFYAESVGYWLMDSQGLLGPGRQVYTAFYLGGEENIVVRQTPVFPSRETAPYFSAEERTMRFDTYIQTGEVYLATQVQGVYGLLNEFNAYYHGTRTAVDLARFYRNEMPQTHETWFEFFSGVHGTYHAYLEFKLYILNYLRYARDRHPRTYEQLLANKDFVRAFLRIEDNHARLMEEYFALKEEIAHRLRALGYGVEENDQYILITQGIRRYSLENKLGTYRALAERLERPEFAEVMRVLAAAANG